MAAYAALVSLMHIIEQIQHHPRPPFYLDNKHAECLIEKVTSLQDFLEHYSHIHSEKVALLESRIAEAAYAAEDLIETHVVDQILAQFSQHGRRICSVDFYQDLQKVIQGLDFIKKEVTEIKERMGSIKDFQQHKSLMPPADSSRSAPPGQNIMVGRDDVLELMMDNLTRKQNSSLQVIPIVGMGGIGKTAVAKNVYDNQYIVQHFDIHAWATVSQEYRVKEILLELLCLTNQESRESLNRQSEVELRDRLYRRLYGKMYLIILDDIWSIEAWDKIKSLFPNNNNGSRVIITTRQLSIALHLTSRRGDSIIEMKFLNDDLSWNLLCKIVFRSEDGCPPKLKKIGRKIVENCQGLPLAIVVIGGLLAKSEKTLEYWEHIAENLHTLEENQRYLNVLHTSYNHLPVHLKPCLLYMGSFVKGAEISVDFLILYWVGEGFLKPISDKGLEEVGIEYLKDLVDRNFILVEKRSHDGKIKSCKIHDLMKEICMRESRKDRFFLVINKQNLSNSLQGINTERRVSISRYTSEEEYVRYFPPIRDALGSASLARTLLFSSSKILPSPNTRLLRVLTAVEDSESSQGNKYSLNSYILQLVNLPFILGTEAWKLDSSSFPSLTKLFWNLHTLFINVDKINSFDIWKMPLLRCVVALDLRLTNPGQDDFVLTNLQTLASVVNFRCSEKMVKRIPNMKKLIISYQGKRYIGSRYCLDNLVHLHKLESLCCMFLTYEMQRSELLQNIKFPCCLKVLILMGCRLPWEDVSTLIGSLPHLEILRLMVDCCIGSEWATVEDQFCNLKVLDVSLCFDLECWTTCDTHFPHLEQIILRYTHKLKEIPLCIGEIPTLQLIELDCCSNSAVISAKEIAVQQQEFGNEDLKVRVTVLNEENYKELESLANHNFLVQLKDEVDTVDEAAAHMKDERLPVV